MLSVDPRRCLSRLTRRQIQSLPDKSRAMVILATGAIEQHGPHLPVAVDAFMGQVWLSRALTLLPKETACYVAPPITYGRSVEHTGFPGTLSVSKETLRLQVLAIGRQLHAWGFRHLAVLNTHGGNTAVVMTSLRELRDSPGLRADLLRPATDYELSPQEATFGFHAGELETAWMLASDERLVDMRQARCEFPARLSDSGRLRPENAPARVSWVSRDLSRSGIMGDATAATGEKGRRWLDHGAERMAAAILAICESAKE